MSYYSKVSSRFWTGDTGRALRGHPNAQVVAAYLITSPHANMLGFYYLPISYIATDTGIPIEGASEALQRLCDGHFCRYDKVAEVVWVFGMAKNQIGESLEPRDKRVISIRREYESIPNNQFLQDFFEEYGKAYHLETARTPKGPCQGACQAPSKPIAVAVAVAVPAAEAAPVSKAIASSPNVNGHDLLEDQDPVVERIPLVGKQGEFEVRKSLRDELDRLYPAVDPDQTLREIRGWCLGNPVKCKTRRGVKAFITRWFGGEQDKQSRRPG